MVAVVRQLHDVGPGRETETLMDERRSPIEVTSAMSGTLRKTNWPGGPWLPSTSGRSSWPPDGHRPFQWAAHHDAAAFGSVHRASMQPVSRLVLQHDIDQLAELMQPRHDVAGRSAGDGVFEADDGPFHAYRRTVSVDQDADPPTVTEVFEFDLAIPVWGALFVPLFKRWLRERRSGPDTPWWSPPDRWDARTSHVVALLAVMTLIAGYLGTLLTQTITFAADEFDASDSPGFHARCRPNRGGARLRGRSRGRPAGAAADAGGGVDRRLPLGRHRRRRPVAWLGGSQTLARGMSTAMALLIGIIAAEEVLELAVYGQPPRHDGRPRLWHGGVGAPAGRYGGAGVAVAV